MSRGAWRREVWLGLEFLVGLGILIGGLLAPQHLIIPVQGAAPDDWHPKSFWYYPWGLSVVHKGIDIFAPEGRPVLAPTAGFIFFAGQKERGGNAVMLLGPQWRFHYFSHLQAIHTGVGAWVAQGERIGTVGTTGNAKGRPPHLHYEIVTLLPYPWRWDSDRQGWKKMFFLDPSEQLLADCPPETIPPGYRASQR
ncbi:MAG: M23 family metallopeptidase [Magnetococcales bacterium]|nr:M23 family metallopeptidase [Magnetococcales bacterium]